MVDNYSATTQSIPIASPGATLGTDWEQRVDFARLEVRPRRQGPRRTRTFGHRLPDLVRHEQHPLHNRHAHRQLGPGQAVPLLPGDARPGPDPVGHRLGGPHPPAVRALERPGRTGGPASPAGAAPFPRRSGSSAATPGGWPASCATTGWPTRRSGWTWWSCRCCARWRPRACTSSTGTGSCRTSGPSRPPTRSRCSTTRRRWSTAPTTSCTGTCGRASAKTPASPWSTSTCTRTGRRRWRRSTRSPVNGAARTRTCSPTG